MIFATDLDRTMIFSKRFLDKNNKNLTIGFKDGKGYSYFTKKQKQMLKDLETKLLLSHVLLVPKKNLKEYRFLISVLSQFMIMEQA